MVSYDLSLLGNQVALYMIASNHFSWSSYPFIYLLGPSIPATVDFAQHLHACMHGNFYATIIGWVLSLVQLCFVFSISIGVEKSNYENWPFNYAVFMLRVVYLPTLNLQLINDTTVLILWASRYEGGLWTKIVKLKAFWTNWFINLPIFK